MAGFDVKKIHKTAFAFKWLYADFRFLAIISTWCQIAYNELC